MCRSRSLFTDECVITVSSVKNYASLKFSLQNILTRVWLARGNKGQEGKVSQCNQKKKEALFVVIYQISGINVAQLRRLKHSGDAIRM